jgi:Diacylglycerol acyltransferase
MQLHELMKLSFSLLLIACICVCVCQKQVFGSFGLIDASRRSLTKALKHQSVVIYVGGMAELFLSTPTEERLYIAKRTGMQL